MRLEDFKVIPVVVLNNEEEARIQLEALRKGELPIAEITFRTEYAPKGIEYAIKNYPDILVGAGTVINEKQCKLAIKLGCKFIVSPGLSNGVAKVCKENNVPYLPGCVTPTEIMEALELGIDVIKFFPAKVYGGLSAIKALGAAFPQVKFVPTGGVDLSNLKEFLSDKHVQSVGGSFMMKGDIVKNCIEINKVIKSL